LQEYTEYQLAWVVAAGYATFYGWNYFRVAIARDANENQGR
jgi:hypothetical protein